MKGIKVTVTEVKTYSFDITVENGFDETDFDNLEDVLSLSEKVKGAPETYCNPNDPSDHDLIYDISVEKSEVNLEFIR